MSPASPPSNRGLSEKPPRAGGIYRRGELFIVHPVNRAVTGIGLASEPVRRLPSSSSAEELGKAILAALASWRDGLPQPEVWAGHGKSFLKATGFRSWRALETDAVYCPFFDDGTNVTFEVWSKGEKGSFEPMGVVPEIVPSVSPPEVVGLAALRALARAK